MGSFFSRLSYSFGNEDWKTEAEALKIQSGDRIVCITGSGDRPLHLLMSEGQEVIAVDANPFQTQLLHLKVAALKGLDYRQYLNFLGVKKEELPLSLYPKLLNHMTSDSIQFWNGHLRMISNGVLYEGSIEKLCQLLAFAMGWLRHKKVKQLFSFDNLEEQKAFIQQKWDNAIWKGTFAIFLQPWVTRLFLKDPGLYAYLGENIRPSTYIRERINQGLSRHLAKDALLVNLAFRGRVPERALPPYLQPEGSQIVKQHLPRLKTQTLDILSYLESMPDNSFDAFSLSDVSSYLSKNEFTRLTNAMLRTAKPNARFCLRQFMSNYQIPVELQTHFKRDEKLEQKLDLDDNCFVYRFTVGQIQK